MIEFAYFLSGCFRGISDLQPVAEVNAEESFIQMHLVTLSDPPSNSPIKDLRTANQCT